MVQFRIIFIFTLFISIRLNQAWEIQELYSEAVCRQHCENIHGKQCYDAIAFSTISRGGKLHFNKSCNDECKPQEICKTLCDCVKSKTNSFPSLYFDKNNKYSSEYSPELICRGERELIFRWNNDKTLMNSNIYMLQLKQENSSWTFNATTQQNKYSFKDLQPYHSYELYVGWLDHSGKLIWMKSNFSQTWSNRVPLYSVENFTINTIDLDYDSLQYYAEVNWTPGLDKTCNYTIAWWDPKHKEGAFNQWDIYLLNDYLNFTIKNLDFETNYSAFIMSESETNESNKTYITFETPSCLETFKNLTFCPPPPPENITISEYLLDNSSDLYSITIQWATPNLKPDYYSIIIENEGPIGLEKYKPFHKENISGNQCEIKIDKMYLGRNYYVTLMAFSVGGKSKPTIIPRTRGEEFPINVKITDAEVSIWKWILLAIVSMILLVSTMVLAIFYILHKRAKKKRYIERCRYFEDLDRKSRKDELVNVDLSSSSSDELDELSPFELQRKNIIFNKILGEGAFGIVRHGWLLPKNRDVAVKMLREYASAEDIQQLKQEIEMMKSVGTHPHIVSMIGCCIRGNLPQDILLVVEYCALGDLLAYLRHSWNLLHQCAISEPPPNYKDLLSDNCCKDETNSFAVNITYDMESCTKNEILTPTDLLSFARQITMGMEYLSANKVVHRDLAARNILITSDRTLKIADFGLSRDIYKSNLYHKTSNGKLPIKWLALESLTHQIYTTQSDVWSFGIVLWEIVTLGGNPYPSIPTTRLPQLLKSGYRMECPNNCTSDIYEIMQACWKGNPKDRPTFKQLRAKIEKLLETNTPSKYLNLESLNTSDCTYSDCNSYHPQMIHLPNSSNKYVVPVTACSNISYEIGNVQS